MEPDEQLYETAANELASSPRTGLMAKCMAKSQGDENKAKAMYLECRVGEMKALIKAEELDEVERAGKDELAAMSASLPPDVVLSDVNMQRSIKPENSELKPEKIQSNRRAPPKRSFFLHMLLTWFFPLFGNRLFNPNGRRGRLNFFFMNWFIVILAFSPALIAEGLDVDPSESWMVLMSCLFIYLIFVNASKRLHDMNFPCWIFPLVFIPIVNLLFLFLSGTSGENKYGDQP